VRARAHVCVCVRACACALMYLKQCFSLTDLLDTHRAPTGTCSRHHWRVQNGFPPANTLDHLSGGKHILSRLSHHRGSSVALVTRRRTRLRGTPQRRRDLGVCPLVEDSRPVPQEELVRSERVAFCHLLANTIAHGYELACEHSVQGQQRRAAVVRVDKCVDAHGDERSTLAGHSHLQTGVRYSKHAKGSEIGWGNRCQCHSEITQAKQKKKSAQKGTKTNLTILLLECGSVRWSESVGKKATEECTAPRTTAMWPSSV
jgi:hypothetical protein